MWNKSADILAAIGEAEQSLGENGRILVRESGTEPLVRVMIEGKNADEVEKWTNAISAAIEKALCI